MSRPPLHKEISDGLPFTIDSVVITARSGITAEFMSLGACIRKVALLSPEGRERVLTLSYAGYSSYPGCGSYAGMTVGPNAGRIPASDGLTANDGPNQLHGGFHNLSMLNWKLVNITDTFDRCSVTYTVSQPDGTDGWPGNRIYRVTYTLTEPGTIDIELSAVSDKRTYINMTNHTYWLLDSSESCISSKRLRIHADRICINDSGFLPVSIIPLTHPYGDDTVSLDSNWNNGFILRGPVHTLRPAAELYDTETRTGICISTTSPAVTLYTGDYLKRGEKLLGGSSFPHCAAAIEPQEIPSVMERTYTSPEHPFYRHIRFVIDKHISL